MLLQKLEDTALCPQRVLSTQNKTPHERKIGTHKRQHKEHHYDTQTKVEYEEGNAADQKARKKCDYIKPAILYNNTTKNIPLIDFFQYLYHIMESGMIELTVLVVAM